MLLLICILGLLSGALALLPSSLCVFACSIIGSVCGVWILYALSTAGLQFRLTSLLASSLLIGYCGGTCYSVSMAILDGKEWMSYVGAEAGWVAYAMLLVLLSCIVLIMVGSAESPLIQERHIVRVTYRQERFLWALVALAVFAYLTGRLGFRGMTGTVNGRISVFDEIVLTFVGLLPAMAAIGFMQSSGFRKLRFAFIGAVGLMATLPVSRRTFAYALILAIFAGLRLSGRDMRISAFKKVVLALVTVVAVVAVSFFAIGMRMAAGGGKARNLWKAIHLAEKTSFYNPQNVLAVMNQNVDKRSAGLIYFLALLSHREASTPPVYGEVALSSMEFALPRTAYSFVHMNKDVVIESGGEKNLSNGHFGLPELDSTTSMLTAGLTDFGLVGLLLYPLLLCAMARGVLWLLSAVVAREGMGMAILYIASLFLGAESILDLFFAGFRNVVVILLIWAVIYYLPVVSAFTREAPVFSPQKPELTA